MSNQVRLHILICKIEWLNDIIIENIKERTMKSFILFAAFIFLAANCAFADTDAAALVDQFKQATDLQQQDLIKGLEQQVADADHHDSGRRIFFGRIIRGC